MSDLRGAVAVTRRDERTPLLRAAGTVLDIEIAGPSPAG